jgi:hypothetical protein
MDPSLLFNNGLGWASMDTPYNVTEERGSAMKITVLGIDLAKHVFQLHGVDERGLCSSARS